MGGYETSAASEFLVGPFRHAVSICENHIHINVLNKVSQIKKDDVNMTNKLNATVIYVSVIRIILILYMHN